MLNEVMGKFGGGLKWGGLFIGLAGLFWTYMNWKDGAGGGAQMTTSVIMMVGGFGAAAVAFYLTTLDTSWAS